MIFEKFVINKYKKMLIHRLDPDGSVFYFGKDDFEGLASYDVSFLGDKGQRLYGHFYYRGQRRTDRLIIFDHGMGCGHVGYMREVDLLTRRGYTVFTYDHTGTRNSEGEHIGGLTQSLADLDFAVNFVRSMNEYADTKIAVIGHSWGGYSTMNISAFHPEITHAVVLSPYISVKEVQNQILKGPLSFYKKAIFKIEADSFPKYVLSDGRNSLNSGSTKALIIHSRDDDTCDFKMQFVQAQKALMNNPRVEFLALDGKVHQPHYTQDAVRMRNEYNAQLKKRKKQKLLKTKEEREAFARSYDWCKMTEQDENVWQRIFEFFES